MQIIHDKHELVHISLNLHLEKFNQQNNWTLKQIVGKNFKATKSFSYVPGFASTIQLLQTH